MKIKIKLGKKKEGDSSYYDSISHYVRILLPIVIFTIVGSIAIILAVHSFQYVSHNIIEPLVIVNNTSSNMTSSTLQDSPAIQFLPKFMTIAIGMMIFSMVLRFLRTGGDCI